jgi:hypothetical protein
MKAIHLTAYGNPAQNLKIAEVSEPKAIPGLTPAHAAQWVQPSRHLCGARQRGSQRVQTPEHRTIDLTATLRPLGQAQ